MSGRWSRAIGAILVVAALVVPASIAGAGTSTAAAAKADPSAILRYATDLSTFGGPALDPTTTKGSPLDFNPIDCEALDALFAFDFLFSGNHDEVVAEALGLNTTLESLLQLPGSRVINYEPSLMLALDDACRLQCRLSIETRTNAYQIRTGQFPEAPISVYFTIRQYWGRQPFKEFVESYRNQRRLLVELVDSHIIPAVVRPLAQTIAAKQ